MAPATAARGQQCGSACALALSHITLSFLAAKVASRTGSNNVYSFLNTGRSASGGVDFLSVLRWLESGEHWIGDVTLGNVQFGWEITSSSGGMNFQVNSYWVSSG